MKTEILSLILRFSGTIASIAVAFVFGRRMRNRQAENCMEQAEIKVQEAETKVEEAKLENQNTKLEKQITQVAVELALRKTASRPKEKAPTTRDEIMSRINNIIQDAKERE